MYRRVSSKGQDLAMQESADSVHRKKYLPTELKIINEYAVSANKLRIGQRPEMLNLVSMILNDQVDKIYTFDRTRLFRDFYEANYFLSICRKKNVQIFFTSSSHSTQQVSDNPLIEGVLSIVGDMEGKNIADRLVESNRRFPRKKLGYIKQKGNKEYVKDPKRSKALKEYFRSLATVESHHQLEEVFKVFKKQLKTSTESLIRIARDPFYAGYDLATGKNRLAHVEAYLTLNQFEELQLQEPFLFQYKEKKMILKEKHIYKAYCARCQKTMKFNYEIANNSAWYSCSNKHPKVMISADDLSKIITLTLKNMVTNLQSDLLLEDSKLFFKEVEQLFKDEQETLEKNKVDVLEKILLENGDLLNWREHQHYKRLNTLDEKISQNLSEIQSCKQLLLGNKTLVTITKDYLKNSVISNPYFLYSMLVEKLYVDQNEVFFEVNRFKYLRNIQLTSIYENGVIK
ncbi:recombinase family protein [Priestia flexa]|uniref:recombinase family protein n=1 Tax=Priestia flexa TaxID=86664 RepID=UPI0021B4CD2C|nr:recombinase family protein [Priestia flexa]